MNAIVPASVGSTGPQDVLLLAGYHELRAGSARYSEALLRKQTVLQDKVWHDSGCDTTAVVKRSDPL